MPSNGAGGHNLRRDPTRPGTVWAANDAEVVRTDGTYRYSRDYTEFPELDPQSDLFTDGGAGARRHRLARLDAGASSGSTPTPGPTSTSRRSAGISTIGASPLAVTPDGRLWVNVADISRRRTARPALVRRPQAGLYSGARSTAGRSGADCRTRRSPTLEVRIVPGGYELWMSCMSRGIAVLFVPASLFSDGFEGGGTAPWSVTVP